ncbi:MAG: hypothetical protein AAF675_12435 [Pseudomonadota bacterium]
MSGLWHKVAKAVGGTMSRAHDALPERPALPDLGLWKKAPIPVYLLHRSGDPEDYFFVLDFEAFMAESRRGTFVRPVLEVWAGRDDFRRDHFARALREAFTREFAGLQQALIDEIDAERRPRRSGLHGLLSLDLGLGAGMVAGLGLMQTLVLWLAVSAGSALIGELRGLLRRLTDRVKSPEERLTALQETIREKQAVIDEALAAMRIRLHPELWEHAFRGRVGGPLRHVEQDAWPLPPYVRAHMEDGESSSWW